MEDEQRSTPPMHSQEERSILAENLRAARKAAGHTQESAAAALAIKKQTVNAWEIGRNLPDALSLRKLGRLYGTATDVLVGSQLPAPNWPFSLELQKEVLHLQPEKQAHMERSMWAFLDKAMPVDLHYSNQVIDQPEPKKTITIPGASSEARRSHNQLKG